LTQCLEVGSQWGWSVRDVHNGLQCKLWW